MGVGGNHPDHTVMVFHQLARALFEFDGNVAVEHGLEQRPGQRLAQTTKILRFAFGQRGFAQRAVDRLHQTAAHRVGHLGRVDPGRPFAQPVERKGFVVERAAAVGLGAGQIGLIVGKIGEGVHANRGLFLQKAQHLGPVFHKRPQRVGVELARRQRVEIGDPPFRSFPE